MSVTIKNTSRIFDGDQHVCTHSSTSTGCEMEFSIFLPPQSKTDKCPVVWYLSGLTCTQENVTTKAGFQRVAAELGLIIICPDTSPRGDNVPDDPDGAYDFGLGAGFYVNASNAPYDTHYKMYDYIVRELTSVIAENFTADMERQSIMGHSMGGHGALSIWLKNQHTYKSVSAFAPIVNPINCPWGQKAFKGYLGDNKESWKDYDSCVLLEQSGPNSKVTILIDQGSADSFLENQLMPKKFEKLCNDIGQPIQMNIREGYDHSYNFIATFMEDHLRHHAKALST